METSALNDLYDYAVKIRRRLHEYPKVGFDLPRTAALVAHELESMGIFATDQFGPCSLAAELGRGETCIAFRADMDALPVEEKTGLPFASKIKGQTHACVPLTIIFHGRSAHAALRQGGIDALHMGVKAYAAQNALTSGVRRMLELAKEYDDAINLTLVEPGFTTPRHIIDAGILGLRNGKTRYTPNAGIKPLRDAIAYKLLHENGIQCDPDKHLIVTAGATQALMLAMVTLVNPGDEVIIQGPNWPDYKGQIDMVNGKTVYCKVDETNDFKMTADLIEPLITDKTKLIIINSPSNPTGGVLDEEDLQGIAELVKKYKLFVISDEPYERLVYDGFRQKSLAALEGLKDYVLTINSFSKTFAMTGFRVGYIRANEKITAALIKLHENMIASVPEPMQLSAIEAVYHGEKDVQEMVAYYDRNRHLIVDGLNRIRGFSCLCPKGAFYVFPNITGFGMSSAETAEYILEKTHVVTSPGSAFGPDGEGYIRICYASKYEQLQEALARMEKAFGTK